VFFTAAVHTKFVGDLSAKMCAGVAASYNAHSALHRSCSNPRPEILHFLKANHQALAALQTERTTTEENFPSASPTSFHNAALH
jgi:hypothetical protein